MTKRLSSPIGDHAGLLLSVATATFVGLRIMSVAAWNPVTAQTILITQSASAVVAGTLIQLLPLVPLAIGLGNFLAMRGTGGSARALWVSIGLGSFTLLLIPWRVSLLLVIVLLPMIVASSWPAVRSLRNTTTGAATPPRRRSNNDFSPWTMRIVCSWAILFAATVVFSPVAWLPTERITSERGAAVGYVLQSSESDALVLVDDPRFVTRIDGAIKDRRLCVQATPPGQRNWMSRLLTSRPLIGMLSREGGYESC